MRGIHGPAADIFIHLRRGCFHPLPHDRSVPSPKDASMEDRNVPSLQGGSVPSSKLRSVPSSKDGGDPSPKDASPEEGERPLVKGRIVACSPRTGASPPQRTPLRRRRTGASHPRRTGTIAIAILTPLLCNTPPHTHRWTSQPLPLQQQQLGRLWQRPALLCSRPRLKLAHVCRYPVRGGGEEGDDTCAGFARGSNSQCVQEEAFLSEKGWGRCPQPYEFAG